MYYIQLSRICSFHSINFGFKIEFDSERGGLTGSILCDTACLCMYSARQIVLNIQLTMSQWYSKPSQYQLYYVETWEINTEKEKEFKYIGWVMLWTGCFFFLLTQNNDILCEHRNFEPAKMGFFCADVCYELVVWCMILVHCTESIYHTQSTRNTQRMEMILVTYY